MIKKVNVFFISVFLILLNSAYPDESDIDTSISSITAQYTITNEDGEILCSISSKDSFEDIASLKSSGCTLPLFQTSEYSSITIQTDNNHEEVFSLLFEPNTLLHIAYTTLHTYMIYDSALGMWLLKDRCPCSNKLTKDISNNYPRIAVKLFFLAYYVASFGYHNWPLISTYLSPKENHQESDRGTDTRYKPLPQKEKEDNSWYSYIQEKLSQTFSQPHLIPLLTIAMDFSAIVFDCQCAGLFKYPATHKTMGGMFYYNKHLWMFLINLVYFATGQAF